jgi:hypothetical protein
LRLLKKPELALKIYERGLTKVKIGADDDRTVSFLITILGPYTDYPEITIGLQSVAAGTGASKESRSSRVFTSRAGRNGLLKSVYAGSNVSSQRGFILWVC